jgi:hypothetical protein
VWQYPYRSVEMPPWGEWRHQNPKFWARSYAAGQQVHRFGVPRAWFPTGTPPEGTPGGAPFLAMGNLVLTGDVQPLAEHILDLYVREKWMYVHVWGEIQDVGEVQTLRLEGWESAEETYWGGTVRKQRDQVILVTDDGRAIQLPDLSPDLADGTQVSVSGGQVGDRLEWHVIQEMSYAEPPPEQKTLEERLTVERVDLVYLALPPNVLPPECLAELGYRAVQPVWHFRGHNDEGRAFAFYVQAVIQTYVENSSKAAAAQTESTKGITAAIMPVLEALFWGSTEDRRALIQYITVGCTTADGLGGPPKCAAGEADGTLVEVFPVGEAEGYFVRPEEIDRALAFTVEGLYVVYRPVLGRDPVSYWPVGEYALLFEHQMNNTSLPLTVFVQEGQVVCLGYSPFPVDPAQLLSEIPQERILIPPEQARALTEKVRTPR